MNNLVSVIKKVLLILPVFVFITPVPVHAHLIGGGGLSNGITHPFIGLDHLLIMIVVGIVSRRKGGNFTWQAPILFAVCTIIGGAFGMKGFRFINVESMIAVSVLMLGVLISYVRNIPSLIAFVSIAAMALIQGHIHGGEVPFLAQPVQYVIGYTLSTFLLHGSGVLFAAYVEHDRKRIPLFRYASIAVSIVGVFLLKNTFT